MNTVYKKFYDIAHDLVSNITLMFGREDLVMVSDLVFHSVISFPFRNEMIDKGWTEAIILGDTRSGKSKTLERLHKHYRCGEFVTGEDVTKAGLVGGMQQVGNRWIITWGRYVRQNREQCTIDEVQNLEIDDIADMSGLRSSGIAEITKIHQSRTEAKVRSIWLGNPRSNRFMNTYSHGIIAIKDLIGKLDDIARFDLAVICSTDEIPEEEYNKPDRNKVEHKYTSDLCHDLIMWAWSRKPEHVKFENGSDIKVLETADKLGKRYSPQIPLVNISEMRVKVARLAVAAACRVFSTDNGHNVIVLPEHVEFIKEFIIHLYDSPTMGYDIFTRVKSGENMLENTEEIEDYVYNKGRNFLDCLLDYDYITLGDISDFTGMDRDDSKSILSFLVKNKCIRKFHASYHKTPAFNRLLRKLKIEQISEQPGSPEKKFGF